MIIIVCGLPGTGKTFLARKLSKKINAVLLSTDKIRKEIIQKPKYSLWERALVYNVLFLIAKYLLSAGTNCILDGTFNRKISRDEAIEKLDSERNDIYIIECICPEDIIFSRLQSRKRDYSDADISVYLKMKKFYEKMSEKHLTIDTSKS
ncbi:MAG TPA: AAA family ATPase, partial [Nitrososphaeraceae archaeon]|nr:AAA family ATPase [Nitrososphaeraceae archaeon]